MRICDVKNELELVNRRVWNKNKDKKGTITNVDMNARFPFAEIRWDSGKETGYFCMCLELELVD